MKDSILAVETTVNALIVKIAEIGDQRLTWKILIISEYLEELDGILSVMQHHIDDVVNNLVDAALHRVDAKLLPVHLLKQALYLAETKYQLTPIFTAQKVEYYYPLMESYLTATGIMIVIPTRSRDEYNLHKLTPFPFPLKNTTSHLIMDSEYEYVLVSMNRRFISGLTRELKECRTS